MLRNNKNEQGTPEGKVFSKQNKRKMRLPNTIGIAVTIWLIFMIIVFGMNDIKSAGFYALKDSMDVNAFYTDGSSKHFSDGDFGSIKKGDRIEVSIRLPENNIDNAELYIPLYNAIVDVYLDGEKIFEDQYDPSNVSAHYGNRIYEIDIPEDYSNRELMLDITSVVSMPFSDLQGIGLVPANESWKRILQGESLIFSTSLALMILALISVFYFIVGSLALKHIKEFQLKMANEDASGSFPFKVAAACGCRHSDEDNYIEPIEAIRQADEIMYENKKMMKAAR